VLSGVRAYIPQSLWTRLRDDFIDEVNGLSMGDVTGFSNFMGAVIDQRSFDRLTAVLERVRGEDGVDILAGGTADDTEGYFVRPTVIQADNPAHEVFTTEYFGPILGVFVYDDADYDDVIRQAADIAAYGLTGAVIAQDRAAIVEAMEVLRFAAGNFYINDKPDRCGGRTSAVRRCPSKRYERQSGVDFQPAPLGITAFGEGTVRTANGLPLPAHGVKPDSAMSVGSVPSLGGNSSAWQLRVDAWNSITDLARQLSDATLAPDSRIERERELARLTDFVAPLETYWADPGPNRMAELRKLVLAGDYAMVSSVAEPIARGLVR
jgi:hypothetical protein